MKNGKSLMEMASEITRQKESKRDFLIPANKVNAFVHDNKLELRFPTNSGELFTAPLTSNGHLQLAQFCDIPKKYYDLMSSYPELLQQNVSHWLLRNGDKKLVRTMDGKIRAILTDKYRRLDNFDLAQAVFPMLFDAKASVESCEITKNKIYIKAITHHVQGEVKKGDVVSAGIIISNSETGHGALSIKPLIYRLVCSNGAIVDDLAMRKYHVGKVDEMSQIEYSNETVTADDNAFWLKVRDLVKFSLSESTFEKVLNTMRKSTERVLESPDKAIELASKKYGFTETENSDVLKHLIQGGDLTSWGLGNAVTRTAQDVNSYDRSTELESIGYQIMNKKW